VKAVLQENFLVRESISLSALVAAHMAAQRSPS
jgi:hypothetical protein